MKFLPLLIALLVSVVAAKGEENRGNVTAFADLEKQHAGSRIGVSAIDLSANRRVDYRANERFTMCSTFKALAVAAVLKRVDENREKLDRFVPYGEAQLLEHAPVTRAHVKEGGMTLDALCAAAITQSDNTAANLLLDAIGGSKGWTDFARSLGDNTTRLDRNEPDLNIVTPGDDRDTTTAAAMAGDLQRLLTSNVLSPASQRRLEGWLQANQTGLKMIRAGVPSDWKIGDKTGRSGTGIVNDIAVVRPPTGGPLFLAIYTFNPGESAEARDELVAEITKAAIAALKK
jgi:beta-lactamase class A